MDFDLSDQQQLLKETVERFLADRYDFEQRRRYAGEAPGWSSAIWKQFAELGLLGLPFEERYGGFGGGVVDLMIVMEAFGRALVLEPYFATVVLGGSVLRHAASENQKAELIPRVAGGTLRLALAHAERQTRYDINEVAMAARHENGRWFLTGSKSLVLHGDSADLIIVSARTAGERRDPDGVSLFLVPGEAAGVSRRGYVLQDDSRAADLTFNGVALPETALVGVQGAGLATVEHTLDYATAALCADAVGAMNMMFDTAVEYLKLRKQFSVPIGSFQALQHRAVDMFIALEQARSMMMFGTMCADADAAERACAVSAAKAQITRSSRFIGQQAIQLHGAIGLTTEYKVGHYFKHLTVIEALFGNADHHLARLARLGGLVGAWAPADCPLGSTP